MMERVVHESIMDSEPPGARFSDGFHFPFRRHVYFTQRTQPSMITISGKSSGHIVDGVWGNV